MLGALLGNYRVVEQLGQGGMGVVYVGRHEQLGHRVVVKVLRPEMSRNAVIVRRFFNEAQAATAIRNPGIAQVYDFGQTEDGRAYFVMELLEGVTLSERLSERPLEIAECCRLARQMANVLQSAHEIGITHRDLKPDNLFLVPDAEVAGGERVKVLDFGIAKLAGELQAASVQTRADLVMGTPSYMSPEQCRGASAVDNRSDIYSLGCVLFKMVCGRAPFIGIGAGDIIGAQLHVQPPALQDRAPDTPPALAALVARMLEKQPDARPQTMAAVAHALEEILRELAATPAPGAMPLDDYDERSSRIDTTPLSPLSRVETALVPQQPAETSPSSSMLETAPVPVQSEPVTAPVTATTTATTTAATATASQESTVREPAHPFAETMPLPVLHVSLSVPARAARPGTAGAPLPGVASMPLPGVAITPSTPIGGSTMRGFSGAPGLPPVMAPAPAAPFGGSPIHGFPRAPSPQPIRMAPAAAMPNGGIAAPRLVRAPTAPQNPSLHSTSTTLGESAGVSSAQLRSGPSRRTLMIGGLAIAIVATACSIALFLGSDPESGDGTAASRPAAADTAAEAAISPPPASPESPPASPPPPSPTLPPSAEGSAATQPSTLTPEELESECNGYLVDRRWAELKHCADELAPAASQRAAKLKTRADGELETAPHIAAVNAALRDRDLRRASEELGKVWVKSLELPKLKAQYAAAETQAISDLAGRLGRAITFTCTAHKELLEKERDAQVPSVIDEATRRAPCTPIVRGQCNATALAEQGRERHAAGRLGPALWSYEASWYCQEGDPSTAKRAAIIACNLHSLPKAKLFWKRLSKEARPTVVASCVNNGITEKQLNAP